MNIKCFCPRWGNELSWNEFLIKVKDAGFDGIEWGVPNDISIEELEDVYTQLSKANLPLIAQHWGTYDSDFNKHYDNYGKWFEMLEQYPAFMINSQTGKDYFTFEQNKKLIELAADHSVKTGVKVLHETHRNKFSFAAHITKEYLQKIPDLKITLDASHWVNVAESYLEDQQEAMDLAISRTEHFHARVGHPQAPQVPDPRVPEWQEALNIHLKWWDKLAKKKQADGNELTVTTEFGPYPYMVSMPFTRQPITNQWEVNLYMMELLRKRYSSY